MSQEQELKSCPFCGEPAGPMRNHAENCYFTLHAKLQEQAKERSDFSGVFGVIEAWNTRASPPEGGVVPVALTDDKIDDLASEWVYIRSGTESEQYGELRQFARAVLKAASDAAAPIGWRAWDQRSSSWLFYNSFPKWERGEIQPVYTSPPAAAAAASEAVVWQPIETAPTDGATVLVLCGRFIVEAWYSAAWDHFVRAETGGTYLMSPSHWMPRPKDPAPLSGATHV